jgi:hypothetical protein
VSPPLPTPPPVEERRNKRKNFIGILCCAYLALALSEFRDKRRRRRGRKKLADEKRGLSADIFNGFYECLKITTDI